MNAPQNSSLEQQSDSNPDRSNGNGLLPSATRLALDLELVFGLQYCQPLVLLYFGKSVGRADPLAEFGHLGQRGAGSATDRSVTGVCRLSTDSFGRGHLLMRNLTKGW